MVGSTGTRLWILRGNSASGKSTIAAALRERVGHGCAIVPQDVVRREILREREGDGRPNIGLVDLIARYSLDHGYHVVVEGMLLAERYGAMLRGLVADHRGQSSAVYLDVPFEETLRRHATKPISTVVGEDALARWYHERDLVAGLGERVVDADVSVEEAVDLLLDPPPGRPPVLARLADTASET